MDSDIICAKCGKHLRGVDGAKSDNCPVKDLNSEEMHFVSSYKSTPHLEDWTYADEETENASIPPHKPPAPPTVYQEYEESGEPNSRGGLMTFVIWLAGLFVIGILGIVLYYVAK